MLQMAAKEIEMGERVSNKAILDSLESGFDRLINALTANAIAPVANAIAPTEVAKAPPVDPTYLAHMTAKAAEHATNKGEEVVLYTRRNKAGEAKLAYALRSRYDAVVAKQPSCTGAIGTFQA